MSDSDRPLVEFERLNAFGKALFLGGAAVRLATEAIDTTVRRAADIYLDAEKAFREGRDPNIDDAKIIDEE